MTSIKAAFDRINTTREADGGTEKLTKEELRAFLKGLGVGDGKWFRGTILGRFASDLMERLDNDPKDGGITLQEFERGAKTKLGGMLVPPAKSGVGLRSEAERRIAATSRQDQSFLNLDELTAYMRQVMEESNSPAVSHVEDLAKIAMGILGTNGQIKKEDLLQLIDELERSPKPNV